MAPLNEESAQEIVPEERQQVELTPEQKKERLAQLMADGKRELRASNYEVAGQKFGEAAEFTAEAYGPFAAETFEPNFMYGRALVELSAVENELLNSALVNMVKKGDGSAEEKNEGEAEQKDGDESMAEEEMDDVREKVAEAIAENAEELEKKETEKKSKEETAEEEKKEEASVEETKEEATEEEKKEEATEVEKKEEAAEVEKTTGEDKTEDKTEDDKKEDKAVEGSDEEKMEPTDVSATEEKKEEDEKMEEGTENEKDGEEGVSAEEGEEEEKEDIEDGEEEDEEEELDNNQLAFEALEVASKIADKMIEETSSDEWKRKKADVFVQLAQCAINEEKYESALEELVNAHDMLSKIETRDNRLSAEIYLHEGRVNRLRSEFGLAADAFNKATEYMETTLAGVKAASGDAPTDEQKEEIGDLMEIIKDIKENAEDCKASEVQKKMMAEEAKKEQKPSILSSSNANTDSSANDISSLVRKKRVHDDSEAEGAAKKSKSEEAEDKGEENIAV